NSKAKMYPNRLAFTSLLLLSLCGMGVRSQNPNSTPLPFGTYRLADIRMRDVCIFTDEKTKTYYAVSAGRAPAKDGFRNSIVRAFTSKDLIGWEGPHTIFRTPNDLWGDINIVGIWAPEMHFYNGKYYLF